MPMLMRKPAVCPGKFCKGCSSARCMSDGGEVDSDDTPDADPSPSPSPSPSSSPFPDLSRMGKDWEEMRTRMDPPSDEEMMAEGGSVNSWTKREETEKGINKTSLRGPGVSAAGAKLHPAFSIGEDIDKLAAKREHKRVLGEMRSMPKPKLMAEGGKVGSGSRFQKLEHHLADEKGIHNPAALAASIGRKKYGAEGMGKLSHHEHLSEGGDVENPDSNEDEDHEIHHMMGEELMSALDAKDKKRVVESLEALIMSLSKE